MGIKVGILGLAGSGKDTFATMLQKHLTDFTIDRYAAPIKELTARLFECSVDDIEDRDFKEKPEQINRDDMMDEVYHCLDEVLRFTDDELDKASELYFEHFGSARAISPREFMQVFGTDVVRAVKPNAWVQHLQGKDGNLIVPDVRFENELCDYNLLITREFETPRPTHPSEQYAWDLWHNPVPKYENHVQGYVHNDINVSLETLEYLAKQHAHRIRKL